VQAYLISQTAKKITFNDRIPIQLAFSSKSLAAKRRALCVLSQTDRAKSPIFAWQF